MAKNSTDGAREHDGGHEPQAATAVRALEHIDVEAAAHELGPSAIVRSVCLPRAACRWLALDMRASEANDLATPLGVRCEHPMINDEVHVGARNQRRELFEQLLRLQSDVIGAVAPRRLKADEDPSI